MSGLVINQTTGDLDFTNNKFSFNSGLESIRQHLQIRLRIGQGEWFMDKGLGVPYFQDIFKKNPNYVTVTEAFKTTILETPGVIELITFDYDYDNATRIYTLTFRALTDEGVLDFSGPVGP